MLIRITAEEASEAKPFNSILSWTKIQNMKSSLYFVEDVRKAKALAKRLVATCLKEDGIGLAAPQVGLFKNIIVIEEAPGQFMVFFNSMWKSQPGTTKSDEVEFCLSVRGKGYLIARSDSILVNVDGEEIPLSGKLARIYQHEYDHIKGISIPQRFKMQKNT